jgi:hypothetical protein
MDIDLVKVVDNYVDNTTAVGFAYSQPDEYSTYDKSIGSSTRD